MQDSRQQFAKRLVFVRENLSQEGQERLHKGIHSLSSEEFKLLLAEIETIVARLPRQPAIVLQFPSPLRITGAWVVAK